MAFIIKGNWSRTIKTRSVHEIPEERYAKELHDALTQHFGDTEPITTLSVKGDGVHWDCKAQRATHRCEIACFASRGPEYLISFTRNSRKIGWGRTSSQSDILDAIDLWLQGFKLAAFSKRLPFVNHSKQRLLDIEEDVKKRFPEMVGVSSEIEHWGCDVYYLHFQKDERACKISFYGQNQFPDAIFYWDECELFQFNAKNPKNLASVINAWVGDQKLPSQMRAEFPWLSMGQLADFYENDNPIEGEFLQSWDFIEEFFAEMRFSSAVEARRLLAQMRAKGYDRVLRAGQSMWTFILSRSRRHGSLTNFIAFDFSDENMVIRSNLDGEQEITCSIEFTPEVEALLQKLNSRAIV